MPSASPLRDMLLRSSALIGAGWAILVAGPALAAGSVDTLASWDGTSFINAWGAGGGTSTYGETFKATAQLDHLSSTTFYIASNDPNAYTTSYQAYVYAWSGSKVVGPALYTSPIMTLTTPASGGFVAASVGLDAPLNPGTNYVVFYTTQNVPQTTYSSQTWGYTPIYSAAGGTFVYANNDAFAQPWDGGGGYISALAMRLQFTDPLRWNPAQAAGAASGGSGVWSASATNWLSTDLSSRQAWNATAASFAGTGGNVTTNGQLGFQQLLFLGDGYSLIPQAGSALVPDGLATILVDASASTSIATPITGSGGLLKLGTGTLALSGANTYAGGTVLSTGTIQVGSDTVGGPGAITSSALGTGTLTFDSGTLTTAGTFTLANAALLNMTGGTIDASGHILTLSGAIADGNGPGSLTLADAAGLGGTVVLSGANTYSGGTTLSGGTLRVGADTVGGPGAISSSAIGTGTLTFDGGTLQAGGDFTVANAAQVNPTNGTVDANGHSFTYAGAITDNWNGYGSGSLTVTDSSGSGGSVTLSGANTYSGGTTLSGGTLRVGIDTDGSPGAINSSAIGTGTLTFNGGVLQAGGDFTIANDALVNGTATIDANGHSFTYAGSIGDGTGPGNLTIVNSAASAGTVSLSGWNGYTGWTTVAGGTLALTGSGDIEASSGVALATGGTFDISGVANGGTTIATLADAASGQAGAVRLGANTLTISNGSTGFSGALGAAGDAGGFTVAGGTQVLSGAVAGYSGATTIDAGATLALVNGASLASSSGVVANGTLSIAGNGDTTLSSLNGSGGATLGASTLIVSSGSFTGTLGAMGDTGGLTKTGAGTFTFAGGNYAGATTVAGGTLIQTGATANVAAVAIAPSATLQTNAVDVFSPAVAIFDAGTLNLNGFSQTIGSLAGGGTVQLGSATLTTTASAGLSDFTGAMLGTGGLTKSDTSTLTLSGASSYSGDTVVNAGILNVTGTLDGTNIIVNAGGTLAGSGTIGDPIINAGGTLAPGAVSGTPTTLTLGGPLVFMPGSFYNVLATPTAADRTVVNGATTINGGTVNVLAGGVTFNPQSRYTILTSSGGITGRFDAVTSNLAFLVPRLVYDPADVTLVLNRNDVSFAAVAQTGNQRAVAGGLTSASRRLPDGSAATVLNAVFDLSAGQARAAFDSLSGEGIAATQNLAHRSAQLFAGSIFDQTTFYGSDRGGANQIVLTAPQPGTSRPFGGLQALAPSAGRATDALQLRPIAPLRELADLPASRPQFIAPVAAAPTRTWRAWGTGFGADEDVRSNAAIGFAAQQNTIAGGSVGVDYQVAPGTLLGLAAGGSDGEFNVPNRATSGSTTGGHVGAYSLTSLGPFYAASSLAGSFYQNRTTRNVGGFGGLGSETEKGSFASREVRARLEAGRGIVAGPYGTLTPFVALEVASLRTDGFTERAIAGSGLFALAVSGQSAADVPAFVGLRYSTVTTLGDGMVFKPVVQMAYVHEIAPERTQFAGINSLPGAVFLVDGARRARDAAQVKAGGELLIGSHTAIFANFDGEFARATQLYGGKGGVKVLF